MKVRLADLKKKVMKKIADAAMAYDTGHVSSYSGLANRIEEDERTLAAIEERTRIYEGSLSDGGLNNLSYSLPLASPSKDAARMGSKQRTGRRVGHEARQEFVDAGKNRGYQLLPLGDSLYKTTTGKKVVIRFANEQKPDRWFLGVRDDKYDIIVLLCRETTGRMMEFVLPHELLGEVWASLSRSGREAKFNVTRSGVNWF